MTGAVRMMQPNGEEDFCGLDRSEFYEAVNSVKASHVGVSTNVVLNKSTYREAKSARATGNFCDEKKVFDLASWKMNAVKVQNFICCVNGLN